MASTFVFIDNASIDRGARRSIRSHVMKGKNAGKVYTTKRQLLCASNKATRDSLQGPCDPRTKHRERTQRTYALTLGFPSRLNSSPTLVVRPGTELSGLASPFEITAPERRSIYICILIALSFYWEVTKTTNLVLDFVREAVYPTEFCKGRPDPSLTIWFEYVLSDETFFHSFIAMSEACMDFVTGKDSLPTSYSRHLALALRLVNGNLSSCNALDDTNLASVVFLCLLSSLREQPLQTKLHFDGLCYMIAARGGVNDFSGNPGILQKARRVDIDLTLQLGRTPVLRKRDHRPSNTSSGESFQRFLVNSAFLDAISFVGSALMTAAQRVAALAHRLDSAIVGSKIDGYSFEDAITSTCYYLLEVQPITNTSPNMPRADAVIHLTLLSFMTTLLFQFGRQRYLRYEVLCRSLRHAFEHAEIEQVLDARIRLWCLTIAGISVINQADTFWLFPRLTQSCAKLGFSDWKSVHSQLTMYPWINSVHDRPAFILWRNCHQLM